MTLWAADFSAAQLSAADLKRNGFGAAVRYIVGLNKEISVEEFRDLTTTPGFALALVQESYAQAAQGGYAVGRNEALAAFARADQLGWPRTRPIYFVCEDPNWLKQPSWAAIEQYLRGVASVVPVSRIGDYGSADQIDHMMALGLTTYGWAVETWPPGTWVPKTNCHLEQIYNWKPGYPLNMGGQVDPNMVLKPDWGQWSATAPVPAATSVTHTGEEAAMLSIAFGPNGRVDTCWVAPDKGVWHSWVTTLAGIVAAGGPVEQLGVPGKDKLVSVSCQWSPDGKTFLVSGQGIDNQAYVAWYDGTKWTGFIQLPSVGPKGLLPPQSGPQGVPGVPGAPGAVYDDKVMGTRLLAVEQATSAAGRDLSAVKPAT